MARQSFGYTAILEEGDYFTPYCQSCGNTNERTQVLWNGEEVEGWSYCPACDIETFHKIHNNMNNQTKEKWVSHENGDGSFTIMTNDKKHWIISFHVNGEAGVNTQREIVESIVKQHNDAVQNIHADKIVKLQEENEFLVSTLMKIYRRTSLLELTSIIVKALKSINKWPNK